jgi:hypothetical protein
MKKILFILLFSMLTYTATAQTIEIVPVRDSMVVLIHVTTLEPMPFKERNDVDNYLQSMYLASEVIIIFFAPACVEYARSFKALPKKEENE